MDTYSPSYSINKAHIYHVSKHSSSHYGSLIDRGANGGLAGSDVRILERTGRTVSVTGIDNHELPGLDIVTCAALLHTNHGKVVLIMHEYAYWYCHCHSDEHCILHLHHLGFHVHVLCPVHYRYNYYLPYWVFLHDYLVVDTEPADN